MTPNAEDELHIINAAPHDGQTGNPFKIKEGPRITKVGRLKRKASIGEPQQPSSFTPR